MNKIQMMRALINIRNNECPTCKQCAFKPRQYGYPQPLVLSLKDHSYSIVTILKNLFLQYPGGEPQIKKYAYNCEKETCTRRKSRKGYIKMQYGMCLWRIEKLKEEFENGNYGITLEEYYEKMSHRKKRSKKV